MIIEERDYRAKPGKMFQFVNLYGEHGLPIQLKHLGRFHGYFTSEIGELNHIVAWWSYDGLDDRMARRARMLEDPAWIDYMAKVDGLLDTQSSRILKPVSFSPLGGSAPMTPAGGPR